MKRNIVCRRGRGKLRGRQINMHAWIKMQKECIIIYSLNPARENNVLSETPSRGLNFQDIPLSWQSFQARCQWGPRVPGVGLATIQGHPLPRVVCAVGSDGGSQRLPAPSSSWGPRRQHLWALDYCVWKQLCDLEQVLWPPWSSAFSFLGKY